MKAFISENELVEEATPACVYPACLMQGAVIRLQAAPLCSEMVQYKKTKKKEHLWKPMLENCSFHSGPFWVKLQWTQHGFGFSVCCVIGPWPAFWASDPCPISTEPNETISPVHFVLSVLDQSPVPPLVEMKKSAAFLWGLNAFTSMFTVLMLS